MNKFNSYVKLMLEADAPEASRPPSREEPFSGRKIIEAIATQLEAINEEGTAKSIRTNILESGDVNVKRSLDDPIHTPEQWNNLAKTLGIVYNISKARPSTPSKPVKKFPKFGKDPGRWNQAAVEAAFYDLAYHWTQGSLLKKIEMILSAPIKVAKGVARGVGKVARAISPTAAGSTGVFA